MEGKDWAQESTACFPHSRTIFQEHHFRDDFRQNHPADDACPLYRITGYRTVFFSVDVHGRRLPLPEETGSFRMPGFADAGEAAMTAAAFQAGGKEVNMEAGVFRTGFRHPPASRLRRL